MKTPRTLSLLALALGLSLGSLLSSCTDNDLDANQSDGNTDPTTEVSEAQAQKYEALTTLLAAVANVDSLPTNWQSADYHVAPTIGEPIDEANPHVRYVATTSLNEADRIYRSLVSKNISSTTPTNDQWQMQGIGTLNFKVENQPNLFATLTFNVQQLPQLEKICFVPTSALGENGSTLKEEGYYHLGDVICQFISSTNEQGNTILTPTFWVCTQPCLKGTKVPQSHWCTFQLVPAGDNKMSNYVNVGKKTYLPTKLCTKKADGEREIMNFFNLLRLMANPNVATSDKYVGIGNVANEEGGFPASTVRDVSYMWGYLDLWNPERKINNDYTCGVTNRNYNPELNYHDETLPQLLAAPKSTIQAFYYGYNKNFISKGDYTIYDLLLKTVGTSEYPGAPEDVPYRFASNLQGYIYKKDHINFKDFEASGRVGLDDIHTYNEDVVNVIDPQSQQFIVKYRTGGELEGLSNSSADKTPTQSFESRSASNNIFDVLLWSKHLDQSALDEEGKIAEPFFCFGDYVSSTPTDDQGQKFEGAQFCIKEASSSYDADLGTQALFMGFPSYGSTKPSIAPTDKQLAAALYYLTQAKIYYDTDKSLQKTFAIEPDETNLYHQALHLIYEELFNGRSTAYTTYDENAKKLTTQVRLSDDEAAELVTTRKDGNTRYTFRRLNEVPNEIKQYSPLQFFTYDDRLTFRETYSKDRAILATTKQQRQSLRTTMPQELNNFLKQIGL